jgi:hypothetical protein
MVVPSIRPALKPRTALVVKRLRRSLYLQKGATPTKGQKLPSKKCLYRRVSCAGISLRDVGRDTQPCIDSGRRS